MLSFPITAVLFDLDGTLRHNVPSADETLFRFTRDLGIIEEPEKRILGSRWAHFYWAQSPELHEDIENFGNGVEREFWVNYGYRYLKSLQISDEKAEALAPELMGMMETEYAPENTVFPCIPTTLQTLRKAGLKLGLVSNRTRSCEEEIQELGLLDFFDFAYVAAEVGVWKPDPRIFDRALELTGAEPDQVLYVGDNYYADIVGAKNAGLQPVLLDERGLFPEAGCTVIPKMADLIEMVIHPH